MAANPRMSMFRASSGARARTLGRAAAAVCLLAAFWAQAQSGPQPGTSPSTPAQPAVGAQPARAAKPAPRNLPNRFAGRAGIYYKAVWGIDSLSVKWAESGELVRFTWRVLDAGKAAVLNDKRIAPSLIDPQAGVSLVVPVLDKVGQLRQSAPPETGRSYWMAFSNKGRIVKRGDRVNVVVGPFRADGLVVD